MAAVHAVDRTQRCAARVLVVAVQPRLFAWDLIPAQQDAADADMQVPGSVVVTHDFIDFVDIKARIKRNDFVGFTAATGGGNRRSTVSQHPHMQQASLSNRMLVTGWVMVACLSLVRGAAGESNDHAVYDTLGVHEEASVAGVPCMCTSSRGQVPGVGLLQAAEGFTVQSDGACFLQCRPCAAWTPCDYIREQKHRRTHWVCLVAPRPATCMPSAP